MTQAPETLNTRALNRALLARQMLLERAVVAPLEAVEHLVGLQAQAPLPPYVALWSRVHDFDAESLSRLIGERAVVRVALMRSTIHLVTAPDLWFLRPLVQPAIDRSNASNHMRHLVNVDLQRLTQKTVECLSDKALTLNELGEALRATWPGSSANDLGMTARALVPLVQVPPRGQWGRSGRPVHVDAGQWLGSPGRAGTLDELVVRYLSAFGPATVADVQVWCGLTGLKEVVERLRPQLRTYRTEQGKELFDIPDVELPDAGIEAPVRFLGEYDNLTLSHADRSRVIDDEVRRRIATRNGQVPGTVLVDGFVRAVWRVDRTKSVATLVVQPFSKLSGPQKAGVEAEGRALLDFLAPALSTDVRIEKAPT